MSDSEEYCNSCGQWVGFGNGHGCPLKEEIEYDYDGGCNCCESCKQDCEWSI